MALNDCNPSQRSDIFLKYKLEDLLSLFLIQSEAIPLRTDC